MSVSQSTYCLVSLFRERGPVGGQKHIKDTLKASLKDFFIDPDVWENLASDNRAPGRMQCIMVQYLTRTNEQAMQ